MKDPGLFTLPCRLGEFEPFDTLADLGSCVNIIPLYLFKKLNIRLLEETDHIFGLADETKSYLKDLETPLLVGRGFLAIANAVINCRMAKITVGEGITRSVFRVKGVDLGEEEAPYWTTLGKRKSYKPWPRSNGVGTQTHYYARKDFLDCHLPGEWEISRDVELNPFKDTLVFRCCYAAFCTGKKLIRMSAENFSSKTKNEFSQSVETASRFTCDAVTATLVTGSDIPDGVKCPVTGKLKIFKYF
uniref:Reverse transcriptase domain-containing protein n=1 Tax=Tanacetum cinerariifolium TaxID=118510 RepID=A0A699K5Y1_TANCI|nr:hypothetical protein [Tanacetum cinerariifolium]